MPDVSEAIHEILLESNGNEVGLVVWAERTTGAERFMMNLPKIPIVIDDCHPTMVVSPMDLRNNNGAVELNIGDDPSMIRTVD